MTDIKAIYDHARSELIQNLNQKQGVNSSDNNAEFSNVMLNAVDSVNKSMMESGQLKTLFEQNDPNVSLAQVMVAGEKAKVGFQAVLQIRNKLIEAYKDIMNMPL